MVAESVGSTGPIGGAGTDCSVLGCGGSAGGETRASFSATFSSCGGFSAGSFETSFVSYTLLSLSPRENEE